MVAQCAVFRGAGFLRGVDRVMIDARADSAGFLAQRRD